MGARARLTRAWILVGVIGLLSVGSYLVIATHPTVVLTVVYGFLMYPQNSAASTEQTQFDMIQIVINFVLVWLPLSGWAAQALITAPKGTLDAVGQAATLTPLLWQGLLYMVLALLIWRRSVVALTLATLLFFADSAVYGYGVFTVFQLLGELGNWPLGLALPLIVRVVILWFLVTSFSATGSRYIKV